MALASSQRELLMVGMSAATYRINNIIRKECRVHVDDMATTEQNRKACETEANVYLILGHHPLIANYLCIGPQKEFVQLEYYFNGNLRQYINMNRLSITNSVSRHWAYQMVQSIAYIHGKGVRHCDLRLDQWLLDESLNPRLCDFNGSGYDEQPHLGLQGRAAITLDSPSHHLPRDPDLDSTIQSDLFALGSSLYELESGRKPYEGMDYQSIEALYRQRKFPAVDHLTLGDVIKGCWMRRYDSAQDILRQHRHVFSFSSPDVKAVGRNIADISFVTYG